MRTLAIGDIHGCLTALETLLEFIELMPDDQLIFLDDYVDRGPQSRGAIEKLIALSTSTNSIFLRGNHDDWMLDARTNRKMFNSWLTVGGKETLKSYGAINLDQMPVEHFEFLEQAKFYFENEGHIFAHAAVSERFPELNTPRWLMWGNFSEIKEHPTGKRLALALLAEFFVRLLQLNNGLLVGFVFEPYPSRGGTTIRRFESSKFSRTAAAVLS